MKKLSQELLSRLGSGTTTLCWCWRLTRNDGVEYGFTDHDLDLSFGGVLYEAATGFTASEIKDSVGLNVDNLEVLSALTSDRLRADDLVTGLYDDAKVEIYRVDWSDPSLRVLMRTGNLGEVRRSGHSFAAEVRGLAHYLQQEKGRLYQFSCDRDVGDSACGVDLSQAAFLGSGTILSLINDRRFVVDGLDLFDADWFSRGLVTFLDGPASGQSVEVKSHAKIGTDVSIELWEAVRLPMQVGQSFQITAGCDKAFSTCKAKFNNGINFRGYPHMPGNDFVTTFARTGKASR